ncbi:MAG: hypothetical protein EAX86_11325 [Candidatus Heimdallarchaeota archaeon]|nr:hypothetical protein [Candidatus Heimdallarchaeota archaeon]
MYARKKTLTKNSIIILVLFAIGFSLTVQSPISRVRAWSTQTHGKIATEAIESLPLPWNDFFRNYSTFFDVHGNDPDGYRSVVEDRSNVLFMKEEPRHFDDHNLKTSSGDVYDEHDPANAHLIDGVFTNEDIDFVAINVSYSSDKYRKGVIEWAVLNYTRDLTQYMIDLGSDPTNNTKWTLVMITMCYVSHYAADATMPFHGTADYDGQLSGHSGIHGYTENTMTENPTYGHLDEVIFSHKSATYIEAPFNQTVASIETGLANVSDILDADDMFELNSSWSDNMWSVIGDMWSGRIDLAAVTTANLWYTAMLDSDLINKINSTTLASLELETTTPPNGWTTTSDDTLWYPSLPVKPFTSTTTTTTTTGQTSPSFELPLSLLSFIGVSIIFFRKRG